MATTYDVLVPVKPWSTGKSRLVAPPGIRRAALAAGFARDVVIAARATAGVASVHVVTDRPGAVEWEAWGVRTLRDRGEGDLNAAIRSAADEVATPGRGVVVLTADLPCLRPPDLEAALTQVDAGRWFVADHHGTGTTLLAAAPGARMEPAFGVDSARRHRESGAQAITGALAGLRLDVDTAHELVLARDLGLGEHTTTVLAHPAA